MGVRKEVFAQDVVGSLLNASKTNIDRFQLANSNSGGTSQWFLFPGPTLVQDKRYLILASLDTVTNGADIAIIDLADGTLVASAADTDTASAASAAGAWVIGAAEVTGVRAIAGQMERVMFWLDDYADVSDSAVRAIFHTGGVLADPADIVTAIGSTPIVSVVGNDLQTGVNTGSGGNFTKDGAGTITAV
jgi:hypothetical protein